MFVFKNSLPQAVEVKLGRSSIDQYKCNTWAFLVFITSIYTLTLVFSSCHVLIMMITIWPVWVMSTIAPYSAYLVLFSQPHPTRKITVRINTYHTTNYFTLPRWYWMFNVLDVQLSVCILLGTRITRKTAGTAKNPACHQTTLYDIQSNVTYY